MIESERSQATSSSLVERQYKSLRYIRKSSPRCVENQSLLDVLRTLRHLNLSAQ